jgi:RND family efflux transporter MFP subunit
VKRPDGDVLVFGGLLLVFALSLILAPLVHRTEGQDPAGAPFAIAPLPSIIRGVATSDVAFVGVIASRAAVDVGTGVEGRVDQILVHLGDQVVDGGRIASIDRSILDREQRKAEAALAVADAKVRQAAVDLKRKGERLGRRSAVSTLISGEELSEAEGEHETASAELASASAARDMAAAERDRQRVLGDQCEVRAPFAGTVTALYVQRGSMIRAGAPVARVIRKGDLQVRFAFPEQLVTEVRAGRSVSVYVEALGLELPAKVVRVSAEVDPASGLVVAEATLGAAGSQAVALQAGLVARVRLVNTVVAP